MSTGDRDDAADLLALALAAACAALEARADEIDDLNVFPVPDGDTGTNMLLTARAAQVAAREAAGRTAAERSDHLVRQTLIAARGNSGMILSQVVRGAAEGAAGVGYELDAAGVAAVFRAAADAGYAAVLEPVEGTMLTVARRMAEGAEAAVDADADAHPWAVLSAAIDAGHAALEETPDQLPVLGEAGVVDSGALGVLVLVEGVAAEVAGRPLSPPRAVALAVPLGAEGHAPSRFRYCTTFVVSGVAVDVDALGVVLGDHGDSLQIMGDPAQVKVHIHTDDPDAAAAAATAGGLVEGVSFDDMRAQQAERDARLRAATARARPRATVPAAEGPTMDPDRPLDTARTALVTDSAADVPGHARPENWWVVPVPVIFGTDLRHDGVDLDRDAFYARLAAAPKPPTTAQPSVPELAAVLEDALRVRETAVCLFMSHRLSGTAAAARQAAREVDPERILVLESEQISMALGLLAMRLQARLVAGCTAAEAEAAVAALRARQASVFSLETLEYLQRGGRIGRAQALAGTLLGVRPLLQIVDGEVAPAGRVRAAARVLPAMQRFVAERSAPDRPLWVGYAHARRPEVLPELERLVAEIRPRARTALTSEIGPTVGTHAGPGAMGVTFVHDD